MQVGTWKKRDNIKFLFQKAINTIINNYQQKIKLELEHLLIQILPKFDKTKNLAILDENNLKIESHMGKKEYMRAINYFRNPLEVMNSHFEKLFISEYVTHANQRMKILEQELQLILQKMMIKAKRIIVKLEREKIITRLSKVFSELFDTELPEISLDYLNKEKNLEFNNSGQNENVYIEESQNHFYKNKKSFSSECFPFNPEKEKKMRNYDLNKEFWEYQDGKNTSLKVYEIMKNRVFPKILEENNDMFSTCAFIRCIFYDGLPQATKCIEKQDFYVCLILFNQILF